MEMDKINECAGKKHKLNLKVVGVGLSRTGTCSLKEAFNILKNLFHFRSMDRFVSSYLLILVKDYCYSTNVICNLFWHQNYVYLIGWFDNHNMRYTTRKVMMTIRTYFYDIFYQLRYCIRRRKKIQCMMRAIVKIYYFEKKTIE